MLCAYMSSLGSEGPSSEWREVCAGPALRWKEGGRAVREQASWAVRDGYYKVQLYLDCDQCGCLVSVL